jgi:APA family basic amino acid/polyamine antiporter
VNNANASDRPLGLVSATALVIASMIGTGVFTTSGFLLADLKSRWAVLAVWLIGGVLAALGALSYGALARRMPESGGEYFFLSRTLHPALGFLAGWISLLVGFSAPLAAVAFAFGEYTKTWLPQWPPQLTGSVMLITFAAIHGLHVQRGAWVQNGAVLIKLLVIVLFVGFATTRLRFEAEPLAAAPISAYAVSLVWVSFSYAGWNAAVYVGAEVSNPERNLPRSLLFGTAIVALLYLALNAIFLFSVPPDALSGKLDVGRIAAEAIGGPTLANIVIGLVCLALVTSASSFLMAGPRVYARMAADGCFPRWLGATRGPPRAAITFQLLIALLLLWTATYESLLTYIGFTLGLCSAGTVFGLIILRRREGPTLAIPGWPWVPLVFLLATLAITILTIARRPLESLIALVTIAIGWPLWHFTCNPRRKL